MIPITTCAFFILVYQWSLKLRLSSTWTPISISHVVASNLTWFADPSSEFVTILKVYRVSSRLYPNDSTLHLSGWNLRSQSDDHLHTQSRSSCNFSLSLDVSVLANSSVYSTNITAVELFWMESGRALMYKTNKVGPRADCHLCPFRWIFAHSYSLFSSGKETSYPPQQWPTYAIGFYLCEETFMWHLVKGLHEVHIYGIYCP